jgi:hypothetical protein
MFSTSNEMNIGFINWCDRKSKADAIRQRQRKIIASGICKLPEALAKSKPPYLKASILVFSLKIGWQWPDSKSVVGFQL